MIGWYNLVVLYWFDLILAKAKHAFLVGQYGLAPANLKNKFKIAQRTQEYI